MLFIRSHKFWQKLKRCQWYCWGRNSGVGWGEGTEASHSACLQNNVCRINTPKAGLRNELSRNLDFQWISTCVVVVCAPSNTWRDTPHSPRRRYLLLPGGRAAASLYHRVGGGVSRSAVEMHVLPYLMAMYSHGYAPIRIMNWFFKVVYKKFSREKYQIYFFRLFSGDIFHQVFFQFHQPPNILVQ